MRKKVLTLGLAMSLVAAPYALAADADETAKVEATVDNEEETVEVETPVEEESTNVAEDVAEETVTDGEVEEETAEEVTEEAVEEDAAAENTTVELTDLDQSWAKEEIKALVETGIISGFPDGTFKPTANMTRDQFAKVLALSLGLEENEAANPFTDAGWAAPYIGALVNAGLTQGVSDNLYGSSANVTREQLAVFFVRALGFEEEVKQVELELNFADSDQVADYAKASVAFLSEIGFIKGIEKDGAFYYNPKGNAERQAVARLAYEFVENGEEYQAKGQALLDSLVTEEEEEVTTEEEVVTEEETTEEELTEEAVEEEVTEEDVVTDEETTTDEEATEEETVNEEVADETTEEEESTEEDAAENDVTEDTAEETAEENSEEVETEEVVE